MAAPPTASGNFTDATFNWHRQRAATRPNACDVTPAGGARHRLRGQGHHTPHTYGSDNSYHLHTVSSFAETGIAILHGADKQYVHREEPSTRR